MLSVAEDHLRAAEPRRAAGGVRPGAERRDLRHLPVGHDAEGPGRLPHRVSATRFTEDGHRGRARSTTCSPTRRSASSGRRSRTRSRTRHDKQGFAGRFGAGLPRINDGSVPVPPAHDLEDEAASSRAARGWRSSSTARRCSPARPGRASREIRRWIIENDWLEAVVALPDQLFYNTGISHLLLDRHQPQDAPSGGARCSSSTPASCS